MKKFITLMCCVLFLTGMCGIVDSILGAKGIEFVEETSIPLPDGLTAVEYLESTGTQYIDTGIFLSSEDTVVLKGFTKYSTSFFGTNTQPVYNLTGGGVDISRFYFNTVYVQHNFKATYNVMHEYILGRNIYLDGELIEEGISGSFICTTPCFLFARSRISGEDIIANDFLRGGIHRFVVERQGEVVCDMISVRKDGVGYMYDNVTGELFGNNGTGEFIIGPDL